MNLSQGQRQYLLVAQCIVPFAINFVLNGILGLLVFGGIDPVPTWGIGPSAGPDLVGTCFVLPAITALIVTPLVRRHVRAGTVDALPARRGDLPRSLRLFGRPLVARSFLFGLASLVCVGSLVAVGLLTLGPTQFGLTPFLWLKASFSGVLAATITPIIGLVALTDAEQHAQAA